MSRVIAGVFVIGLALSHAAAAQVGRRPPRAPAPRAARIADRVVNHGFYKTPHMYCYHINVGHPVLDQGSRYLAPIRDVVWAAHAGDSYRKQNVGYRSLPAPQFDFHEQVWQHEMVATQPPAVGDGLLVVAGDELLAAFDTATGAAKWSVPVTGGFAAPPARQRMGRGGGNGRRRPRDPCGRRQRCCGRNQLGMVAVARPFIAGDGVYLSLSDNRIVALGLSRASHAGSARCPGGPAELLVLDDRLFVGADDKYFYCLNTKHGKNRWRWRTGGKPVGAAAIDEKHVYYIGLDNILWALDRNGGTLKWKAQMPVRPSGGPIVLGTIVVVAAVQEEVYGYRVATGAPLGKASHPPTSPRRRSAGRPEPGAVGHRADDARRRLPDPAQAPRAGADPDALPSSARRFRSGTLGASTAGS
jgi:outer membrane protein assembly factor BamB